MYRFMALCVVALLAGCASVPPKTEAIHHVLVTDSAIRQAVDQCGSVGIEERRLALREQAQWWQRNNTYVLAADFGILELNWAQISDSVEAERAILAMQLLELIQLDADAQLEKWFGQERNSKECQSLFNEIAEGRFDIFKLKKTASELDEIYQRRVAQTDDVESARSINSRYRKYGRSLFVVEKSLQAAGCDKPNIALLRNSWPLEVYDAVCDQQEYLVVKCEWGRCEVKH